MKRGKRGKEGETHHLDQRDCRNTDLLEVVRVCLPWTLLEDVLLLLLVVAKDVVRLLVSSHQAEQERWIRVG
jgi:hypothetical protein